MAAWLTPPVQLHSSRAFECGDPLSPLNCTYYQHHWRDWYKADYVFALPTVGFFMAGITLFTAVHLISSYAGSNGSTSWKRAFAFARYFAYRGFHVRALNWNTAPLGVLLLAAVGTIYFFCMDLTPSPYYWPNLDWGGSPPLGTRSGWMALACMPFVFATASKANWITLMTGISHEKLQVYHRWISYAFFVLALMHTFPFIIFHVHHGDMVMQVTEMATIFYWTGIVALVFQAWLTFASFGPFRRLGSEFVKTTHFICAAVFMLIFFFHCDYTLTSWDYFIATAAIYVPCLLFSWARTYIEYGFNQQAQLFVEDNDFIRVVIPVDFHWLPGQHCFLRFRKFGLHAYTSHPFTICSLPSTKLDKNSQLVFYIRPQGGFTSRLYKEALAEPGVKVPVFVDGPYGGIHARKFADSDRLLVVAGGSGAGWSLPFVERFVRRQSFVSIKPEPIKLDKNIDASTKVNTLPLDSKAAARPLSLRVILVTRENTTREWYQQTLKQLLSEHPTIQASESSHVEMHLTGNAPADSLDLDSGPDSPDHTTDVEKAVPTTKPNEALKSTPHGRPSLPSIIREEAANMAATGQSLGVFVCGPDSMQQDVRNAVASENLRMLQDPRAGGVYLHLEHFNWA